MTIKDPELCIQSVNNDHSTCPDCHEPFEPVRPGKAQPTCACQDKCPDCEMMRSHFASGEISQRRSGFLCPHCDADDDIRERLFREGLLPARLLK